MEPESVVDALFRHPSIEEANPELAWDCTSEGRDVVEALFAVQPGLKQVVEGLRGRVPVQARWAFGRFGNLVRPERHVRAFYLDLGDRGAIAFKGTEPRSENFADIIERMERLWSIYAWGNGTLTRFGMRDDGYVNALERFPTLEGKPPGAHALWDAREECECALDYQRSYLKRYSELSPTPVPLFVYEWPREVGERAIEIILPKVSSKIARMVKAQIRDGIGSYVYYYRRVPSRVAHVPVPEAGGELTYSQRRARLGEIMNVEAAIHGWIREMGRLLCLGYVATDPSNLNRGYLVQPQNLVLDGGFVDLNSLMPMSEFHREEALDFAIMRTIQSLTTSISRLLVGHHSIENMFYARTPELFHHITNGIARHIRGELEGGKEVHPNVAALADDSSVFANLDRVLSLRLDTPMYSSGGREESKYVGSSAVESSTGAEE